MLFQFLDWAASIARFDFATSLWHNRPALEVVMETLPNTLALGAIALAIAFVAAVIVGSLAALNEGRTFDRVANVISQAAASVPDFWLGLMGILVFAVSLRLVPASGFGGPIYWVLPVACLLARPFGTLVQIVRGSMVDALDAAYVRTGKPRAPAPAASLSSTRCATPCCRPSP